MKFFLLIGSISFLFILSCEREQSGENNKEIIYKEKDTIIYLPFNESLIDESNYKHPIYYSGELFYMNDKRNVDNSAIFFNGNQSRLSFEINADDTLQIDFNMAPFKPVTNSNILDFFNSLLEIKISDIDTQYVDAYSAATYTLSATHNQAQLSRNFEVKPYTSDTSIFDLNSKWQQIRIVLKAGTPPEFYVNGFEIGEFSNPVSLLKGEKIRVLIGNSENLENSYIGKIDELLIKNFKDD